MATIDYKKLILGSIQHHFDGALQLVAQVGGSSKAAGAIAKAQASLLGAAEDVEAREYSDEELSPKLTQPGVDLAYRRVIVSDSNRDDEWIAVLAVGLEALDEHTRRVVESWSAQMQPPAGADRPAARRLLVFVVCADKVVTMNPVCGVAHDMASDKLALAPGVFRWSILQPNGQYAVVGHVDVTPERQEQLARMLAVLNSPHAAQLMNEHVQFVPPGHPH